MISAVIVSHNEAKKLKKCLRNVVNWADEVVVVDLESTDNTQSVVSQFKCKFIKHKFVPYVELVRNFAISQCAGDWILVLDPDERLPKTLKINLKRYARSHRRGILNIPRMNYFFGRWIKHTNFWPDKQIRFFSRGDVKWHEEIHSYPQTKYQPIQVPSKTRYSIFHFGYDNFFDFIERQNRYSSIRAREKYRAGHRFSYRSFFYQPLREFLARYIKHRGFLDGKRGLFLTLNLMLYHCFVEWKLLELHRHASQEKLNNQS